VSRNPKRGSIPPKWGKKLNRKEKKMEYVSEERETASINSQEKKERPIIIKGFNVEGEGMKKKSSLGFSSERKENTPLNVFWEIEGTPPVKNGREYKNWGPRGGFHFFGGA